MNKIIFVISHIKPENWVVRDANFGNLGRKTSRLSFLFLNIKHIILNVSSDERFHISLLYFLITLSASLANNELRMNGSCLPNASLEVVSCFWGI